MCEKRRSSALPVIAVGAVVGIGAVVVEAVISICRAVGHAWDTAMHVLADVLTVAVVAVGCALGLGVLAATVLVAVRYRQPVVRAVQSACVVVVRIAGAITRWNPRSARTATLEPGYDRPAVEAAPRLSFTRIAHRQVTR